MKSDNATDMIHAAMAKVPRLDEECHVEASLKFELPHALGCGSPELLALKIAHDIRRLEIMLEKR